MPGGQFRCPIVFKQQNIFVQVMGTVKLMEKIEVAPSAGSMRSGCEPWLERGWGAGSGFPPVVSLHFLFYLGERALMFTQMKESSPV